jgi:hypothetical protein
VVDGRRAAAPPRLRPVLRLPTTLPDLVSRVPRPDLASRVPLPDVEDVRRFALQNLARGLDSVPDAVVDRVAGRTEVDGQVLEPHLALILRTEQLARGREGRTAVRRIRARCAT